MVNQVLEQDQGGRTPAWSAVSHGRVWRPLQVKGNGKGENKKGLGPGFCCFHRDLNTIRGMEGDRGKVMKK